MSKMFSISSFMHGTLSGKRLVTSYHGIMRTNNNKLLWWVGWTSRMTTIHQHPRTTALVDKTRRVDRVNGRLHHNSLSLLQAWSSESDSIRRQVSTFTVNFKTTDHSPMLWTESAKLTKKLYSRKMFQTSDTPTRLFKSHFRSEEVPNYSSVGSPAHVMLLLATWFDSLASIIWLMSYNFIRRNRIVISLELQLMMLMELV